MGKDLNKKEVIEEIKNFIESRAEIIFAYIFGSFVENETFNDIDLAIYIDENIISTRKIFYEIELSNHVHFITR